MPLPGAKKMEDGRGRLPFFFVICYRRDRDRDEREELRLLLLRLFCFITVRAATCLARLP